MSTQKTPQQVISEMVDSGLFSDVEIRSFIRQQAETIKPKTDAEKIASFVTPKEKEKPNIQSVLKNLSEMFKTDKEGIKRLVHPVAGQFGPSAILSQAGQEVGKAVRASTGSPWTRGASAVINPISDSLTSESIQQQIGAEGLTSLALPLAATSKIPFTNIRPGLPVVRGAARRALGVEPSQIKARSGFEALRKQAITNRITDQALKENLISPLGAMKTQSNAQKLITKAASELDDIITKKAVNGRIYLDDATKRIVKSFPSDTAGEQEVLKDILDKLQVTKNKAGSIDLKVAQKLKSEWAEFGYKNQSAPSYQIRAYRKASRLMGQMIEEEVKTFGKKAYSQYKRANFQYHVGIKTIENVQAKAALEKTRMIGIPSMITLGGAYAITRNPLKAAAAALAVEGAKRHAMPTIAKGLYHGISGTSALATALSRRKNK